MSFLEALRLALQTIRVQKLKSGFALIGVFIGVTFLIGAWSIVNGMNVYMVEKFAGTIVGVNTFHLRRRPNFTPNVSDSTWRAWARRPRITFDDATAVAAALTVPVITAWESSSRADLEYGRRTAKDVEVTAATERFFDIKNMRIAQGRPFTAQEVRAGAAVLVMGWDLADRLFEGRDPLDRRVKVRGVTYRVIGVVARQGNLFGISLDKFVVAPALSPLQHIVNPPRVVDALIVKAATEPDMRAAMLEAEAVMRTRRHLRPLQENNFVLETAEGVLAFWAGIQRFLLIVGPGLVAISLVVGGIVIMNIMLMAVAERTREIGLRKSLGARRRDILSQFLAESAALALVGAALGIATGVGLSLLLDAATPLPASVSPLSIMLGVAIGGGLGIVAGVYPASRAARLDPITALRQE
jgi:putative ABC transport system permease protein